MNKSTLAKATYSELAEKVGKPREQVYRSFTGSQSPTLNTLRDWAGKLECSVTVLIEEIGRRTAAKENPQ